MKAVHKIYEKEIAVMNKMESHNIGGKLLTYQLAQDRFNLGRGTITKIAKENNCFLKIGKSIRIDADAFEKALEAYRIN